MNKKLVSNFIYQGIYQISVIILPIITIPIVSHALGVRGIGLFNYIMSIISYFVLTAGLGLATYGIREIATVKDNKHMLSKKFWELEFFNIGIVFIVIFTYFIFLLFIDEKLFFLIGGITLLATLFDISWFYYGIQEFRQITTINILIKVLSFFLILIYVKEESDLKNYFLIQSLSVLISNVTLWFFLKGKVNWVRPRLKEIMSHLRPALHFFIGKISITLYTTLNKTLLGFLGTTVFVGIYTNSLQLVTIFVTLIGTIDTVLLPYMTNLFTENNDKKMIRIMEKTIDMQLYFSIPMMFGILATNKKLIPWFYGSQFIYLEKTVPIIAPLVVIMPIGISIVRQYLMPQNKIKKFNYSVFFAAIVSVCLNLFLIPIIGIWGAIIATIVSELTVTLIRFVDLKKSTDFKLDKINITYYFLASFLMYISVVYLTNNLSSSIKTTCIQGIIGIVIYVIITTLLKKNPVYGFFKSK